MKTNKWFVLIIIVFLLIPTISSCGGIVGDFYDSQKDYQLPPHLLESNTQFEVVWVISKIRAGSSDRRPTLTGGTGKIIVEGLEIGDVAQGSIYGLNSGTGDIIWQIPDSGSGNGEKIIRGDILYRGTAGIATIQAYNLENGKLIWQTSLTSAHSVVDIYYSENKIFAYTSDDEFYILNQQGEILESSDVTSRMFLVMNGVLYMDNVYSMTAIDYSSKKELWRLEIGKTYTHAPVFDDGTIFLRTWKNPASIYSINQSSGTVNWKLSQEILSNLYVEGNKIYFINKDSYLVIIDRYTGNELSKVKFMPSFDLNKQVSGYFVTGDPTNHMLVVAFGDNTQIMGLKIMNP